MRPDRVWAFVNVDSHQLGGRSDGHELPNQHCSRHVQALHQKNDSRLALLEESRNRDYPSEVNVRRLTLFYRQRELIPEAGTRSVNRNAGNIDQLSFDYQNTHCEVQLLLAILRMEDAAAELSEIMDDLHNLHAQVADELDNPTCPLCGEKQMARVGVDDERWHQCGGA